AALRARRPSLVSCWAATWRCRSQTLSQPPLPSHSGYWIRPSKTSSTRNSRRIREKPPTGAALDGDKARRPAPRVRSTQVVERLEARVRSHFGQFLFDTQQLVVLGHAVRARQRARLDLHGVGGHRDIGNGGVFGFARTVRHDGGVAGALGHFDGGEGFSQGA